jgi:signal transduction histidine kinase
VPAIICIYVAFIIATSFGVLKYITLVIYTVLTVMLIHFPETVRVSNIFGDGPAERLQLSIDFMAISIIVALFVIYLKNTYLKYREDISKRIRQLKRVAVTLEQKNDLLISQQEEIQMMNDNLESIIHKRIQNIEEKNTELSEYAFINAHMLRAPVCRILGLVNLIEMEDSKADLTAIKKYATEVDAIIRNINKAVN